MMPLHLSTGHSGARRPTSARFASYGGFEFAEAQRAKAEGALTTAAEYGFRVRRHSASKTRVNALMAAPRNDEEAR